MRIVVALGGNALSKRGETLTDVAGVFTDWGGPDEAMLHATTPLELGSMSFPAGSMGPKVDAACDFARATGGFAAIGRLEDCMALVQGTKGTRISVET
ncbi:hypothetical protein [Roseobacter sp.]|uniref:hypothetical protein n=1 Tax=Roseobacter sp. TaxID=1907202 RepID=UPI00385A2EC8